MGTKPHVFIAPARYIQGADVIMEIGAHIAPLGKQVLAAGGIRGLQQTRKGREASFAAHGIAQVEHVFGGETCDAEIDRMAAFAAENECDVLLACGGGKVIDTVKAAGEKLCLPVVIVPTIASNDSPCSALAIVYNEDGTFNRRQVTRHSPDLVLVDSAIIAAAPVHFLVAGMGDALATWFEADACYKSGAINLPGGTVSLSAITLARLCYDTLMEHGISAKSACEQNVVTPALDKVIEANTLLSGLGFESCGVAVAHALSEGFSAVPEMHAFSHGEMVAFGLLAQLVMENHPDTDAVLDFCRAVGLPTTLADLNAGELDRAALLRAAEIAADPNAPAHNMPFPVTAEMLVDAMLAADALGRAAK